MTTTSSPNPVHAPAHIHSLLHRLHTHSTLQESLLDPNIYTTLQQQDPSKFDSIMRTQFVALDQDKCQFVYQIARMLKATQIVEAGCSFGVSTIYLALAVQATLRASPMGEMMDGSGRVVTTEKEGEKVKVAREHWKEAGEGVERYIELREGDVLETLKNGLYDVDLLLLDIWAPLALPTLKIVQPKLRSGAVVIVDNTISAAGRYEELLEYMRAPGSGFSNLTIPYQNGLEMSIYHPPNPSEKHNAPTLPQKSER